MSNLSATPIRWLLKQTTKTGTKMNPILKRIALFCVTLGLCISPLIASSQPVTSIADYRADYEKKWVGLVSQLEQGQEMSAAQKMNAMEQNFKRERWADYQAFEVTETAEQLCRGKTPRTKIRRSQACATKCVERPNEDMYTSLSLVKFEGPTRKEFVTGTKACFRLKVWGAGVEKGRVTATFKYRDSYIEHAIEQDAKAVFSEILETN